MDVIDPPGPMPVGDELKKAWARFQLAEDRGGQAGNLIRAAAQDERKKESHRPAPRSPQA